MRHKITLLLITFCFFYHTSAQNLKEVRLNFGFQYNFPEKYFNSKIPDYNYKNGGGGLHVYPKLFYNKNNAIGVNLEYNLITEDYQTDAISSYDIVSVCPTYTHYFFKNKIRPFVGIGVGNFSLIYFESYFNVGVKPIIGVSIYNYVDISLEYTKIVNKINIEPGIIGTFDNYFFGVKTSFSLGLAKLKNKKVSN